MGVGLLSLDKDLSLGLGDGLTLICAVGFAFQIFLTSIFVKKYRASVLNFIQMCTAGILSLIFMIASGQVHFQVTAKGWWSVLYLGIISTTVCYLLQTACQKYVDETKAAIILSMESVFGTLFSVMILHESITLRMILGCAIILAAVVLRIPATGGDNGIRTASCNCSVPSQLQRRNNSLRGWGQYGKINHEMH